MDNNEKYLNGGVECPRTPESPIFIIGYMACGKTTFGKALAKAMGRHFIDLDFYIEQRFRMPITKIFATKGEEGFRRMEASMLREVGEFENVVVACGGGTPCFNGNMDFMLSHGETVWIETSVEKMVSRLMINNSRRPLMAGKSEEEMRRDVVRGLEARTCWYSKAPRRISGEELECIQDIDEAVRRYLS